MKDIPEIFNKAIIVGGLHMDSWVEETEPGEKAYCPAPNPNSQDNSCGPGGDRGIANSPEFKAWFGDSKVVDEDGNPLVVYHSSDKPIESFRPYSHFGTSEAANDRAGMLRDFSENVVGRDPERSSVYPVYLKLENPLEMPDLASLDSNTMEPMEEAQSKYDEEGGDSEPYAAAWESETDVSEWLYRNDVITVDEFWEVQYSPAKAMELLKEKGYDGIVYTNAVEDAGSKSYIIFDSTQVKSATNNTTFDPKNPDITKSRRTHDQEERPSPPQ